MLKVYKYATGVEVPEDATYLKTVTQTSVLDELNNVWVPCWLVWHYFLVEVEDEEEE